jgi:hypothetical protein
MKSKTIAAINEKINTSKSDFLSLLKYFFFKFLTNLERRILSNIMKIDIQGIAKNQTGTKHHSPIVVELLSLRT